MANLARSQHNKMIAGVMGGIAQRFDWDVSIVRILFVLLSIASAAFPGVLVYLVLWIIMPKEQQTSISHHQQRVVKTIYPDDK